MIYPFASGVLTSQNKSENFFGHAFMCRQISEKET